MKIKVGHCPFCDTKVFDVENNETKRLPNYSQFWVLLSDGSKMKVAKCKKCKLSKAKVKKLMKAHQEFWVKGIENAVAQKHEELEQQKEHQIKFYNNLDSLSYGTSEKDLEE